MAKPPAEPSTHTGSQEGEPRAHCTDPRRMGGMVAGSRGLHDSNSIGTQATCEMTPLSGKDGREGERIWPVTDAGGLTAKPRLDQECPT